MGSRHSGEKRQEVVPCSRAVAMRNSIIDSVEPIG